MQLFTFPFNSLFASENYFIKVSIIRVICGCHWGNYLNHSVIYPSHHHLWTIYSVNLSLHKILLHPAIFWNCFARRKVTAICENVCGLFCRDYPVQEENQDLQENLYVSWDVTSIHTTLITLSHDLSLYLCLSCFFTLYPFAFTLSSSGMVGLSTLRHFLPLGLVYISNGH